MPDSKRKKFVYKKATFLKATGNPKTTLESLLRAAIKKIPKALDRFENPAGSDLEKRFLNYSLLHTSKDGQGSIFGCEFLAFEEGEGLSTLKIDPTANEIPVDAVTAKEGEEFLAGAVYFGAINNHVVICGSRGLKIQDLEHYLNWLLCQKSKVLSAENRITLNDHIPRSKRALFKGVKGIQLSAPVILEPSVATRRQAEADKKAQEKAGPRKGDEKKESQFYPVKMAGKAWDAVKALVGDSFQLPSEISVENLADTPNIEVQVFLRWKGRHHEEDSDFLDGVASNLRHVDSEVDYEVKGSSGTLSRDDIKIFKYFQIPWNDSGRPKMEEIFPKMAEWLAGLVTDGKVDS